jgi:hypothetical protein
MKNRHRLLAASLGGVLGRLLVQIHDHDPRTALRQAQAQQPAHAGTTTRHERCLALEILHPEYWYRDHGKHGDYIECISLFFFVGFEVARGGAGEREKMDREKNEPSNRENGKESSKTQKTRIVFFFSVPTPMSAYQKFISKSSESFDATTGDF